MTISIRDNEYLPAKGEILEVSVAYVWSKNVEENILVCTAYKAQPVKQAKNFSFSEMAQGGAPRVEVQTVAEEVPAFGDAVQTEA